MKKVSGKALPRQKVRRSPAKRKINAQTQAVKRKPVTAKSILTEAGLSRKFWGKKLIAAEKTGPSYSVWSEAFSWMTCACGKQDPRIPRHGPGGPVAVGCPKDRSLADFGGAFAQHLYPTTFNAVEAAKTLVKIERRAAIVLREVLKKEKAGKK